MKRVTDPRCPTTTPPVKRGKVPPGKEEVPARCSLGGGKMFSPKGRGYRKRHGENRGSNRQKTKKEKFASKEIAPS